jgi:2-polyprenyl-3-methyl-5-hydroxy-6-metoxy-1,4-benzoquinol methylase
MKDNSIIAEIGAGCGEFADLLHRRYPHIRYIGFDGNYNTLVAIHEAGYLSSWTNFEKSLPIASDSIDIVVSLEVIEHIANAEKLLEEFHRVLKNSGYLILSTPNIGFFVHRLRYLFKAEVLQEGIHLRFFNQKRLHLTTKQAGFQFLQQRSCMPWLGFNTLARQFGGKPRFRFASPVETLLATNFVWLLEKRE